MRCAAAKWRRCAKCRSVFITAASIRRRCSCCSPASMPSAPATSKPSSSCGRTSRRRSDWIDGPGDPDGDGFVEYMRASEQGLANQGWKDSHDAIFHADGRLAEGAIALVEVQGYVYAAKRMAARCARRHRARRRRAQARRRSETSRRALRGRRSGVPRSRPMRWRSTATKSRARCAPRMPGRFCSPALPRRSRRACRQGLAAAELLFRLGHSHRGDRRGALQSDVVSQRLGLAARQCADRARLGALRTEAMRSRLCSRACSTPPPTWICGGCRNCSAASSASAATARRSIRSPARRRPGRARRRSHCSKLRWVCEFDPFKGEIRLRNPRLPEFLDEVMLRDLRLRRRASICGCAVTAIPFRSIRHGSAAISGFRSSFRPDHARSFAIFAAAGFPTAGAWNQGTPRRLSG